YVGEFPASDGNRYILVITDRLGKGVIFIGCPDMTAETMAQVLITHVIRHHGLPRAITSDRGSQIVGHMWRRVCELLQIEQRLSTAYHPETDGATERANQVVEEYLRHFVSWTHNDWN